MIVFYDDIAVFIIYVRFVIFERIRVHAHHVLTLVQLNAIKFYIVRTSIQKYENRYEFDVYDQRKICNIGR